LNNFAYNIVKQLQDNGFEAVYAGGCVRDFIRGVAFNDVDIATNAHYTDVMHMFPNSDHVGAAFGVVIVKDDCGNSCEVASYRSDSNNSDGRRPDSVKFGVSMREDSDRRDFTINAMYMDPVNNKIYDFHSGVNDIQRGVVKFVGNGCDRIVEDHLRIMRAVRFAARFGFNIDKDTFDAIIKNVNMLSHIAVERVAMELNKMFMQTPRNNRAFMFNTLRDTKIFDTILPEITAMIGVNQPINFHPEGDVYNHVTKACVNLPDDCPVEVFWATLLHDVGKPATQVYDNNVNWFRFNNHATVGADVAKQILTRFRFSNDFVKIVSSMVANHMKFMNVNKMKKPALRRFFAQDHFNWHLMLHKADCDGSNGDMTHYNICVNKMKDFSNIDTFINQIDLPKPFVNGHDLIAMGFKQGPIFKNVLSFAMDMQLDGCSRDDIISKIEELIR
jgi:putative nucleotidyltransferase with HDIG domain